MVAVAVSALAASSCSLTERKPEPPIVVTRLVKPELPPEVKIPAPPLSPKFARDFSEDDTWNGWAHDRTGRNIAEARRAACVATVEGTP